MTVILLPEPERVHTPSTPALLLDRACGPDLRAMSAVVGAGFGALAEAMARRGLRASGPPRCIYTGMDETGTRFTLVLPVEEPPDGLRDPGVGAGPGEVRLGEVSGARSLRFLHRGPYDRMTATYDAVTRWMREHGLIREDADWARYMPMWEEYVDDPDRTPPDELRTWIHVPEIVPPEFSSPEEE